MRDTHGEETLANTTFASEAYGRCRVEHAPSFVVAEQVGPKRATYSTLLPRRPGEQDTQDGQENHRPESFVLLRNYAYVTTEGQSIKILEGSLPEIADAAQDPRVALAPQQAQ